jgi:hypothetical protein
MVRHRGTVWAEFHQFSLVAGDSVIAWDGTPTDELMVALPGGAVVVCGIHTGLLKVEFETHAAPPAPTAGWDQATEVDISVPGGELHLQGWGASTVSHVNLAGDGPGTYRVRCSARGRDIDQEDSVAEEVEHYRFDVWRVGPAAQPGGAADRAEKEGDADRRAELANLRALQGDE